MFIFCHWNEKLSEMGHPISIHQANVNEIVEEQISYAIFSHMAFDLSWVLWRTAVNNPCSPIISKNVWSWRCMTPCSPFQEGSTVNDYSVHIFAEQSNLRINAKLIRPNITSSANLLSDRLTSVGPWVAIMPWKHRDGQYWKKVRQKCNRVD